MANGLSGLISALIRGARSKDVTEHALEKAYKKKNIFKTIRTVLFVVAIIIIVLAAILGYFGIIPITANGGLTRIKGGDGAFDAAYAAVLGVLLFIIAPVVAVVGFVQAVRFTLLGIAELLGADTSDTVSQSSGLIKRLLSRLLLRILLPVGSIFGIGAFLPEILSQLIGLVINLAFSLRKDRAKSTPYMAYLFALVDAVWAGADGSLLSWARDIIPAIKPAWTSGVIGGLLVAGVFAFFTGLWSIFSNKEQ